MKLITTINGLSQADIFSKPLKGQLVQKERHSGDFMFICLTGIKSDTKALDFTLPGTGLKTTEVRLETSIT